MARSAGLVHHKLPPDSRISTRQPLPTETPDREQTAGEFEQIGLDRLRDQLQLIARKLENLGKPVDEYNSAAITGAWSSASLTVNPTYELVPEKITAIIITGPTGAIKLQLGDRLWNLTIPATGILVIAPVAVLLSRTDDRILTPQTPGAYTLELCGFGDARFSA